MLFDGYAGAIDYRHMERCLEQCQAHDEDHPVDIHRAVRHCVCPCMAGEDRICNALASSLSAAGAQNGTLA